MAHYCDVEVDSGFKVVLNTNRSQAATMALAAGEKTGGPENRHEESDQWMYVLEGNGKILVEDKAIDLKPRRLVLIEAGEAHEVQNTGKGVLKTINVYAPPEY
jgi:mannose-6-phosphate isomerase-like protein (cupin superfamily)